ncbi:Uncharacterized protein FWK35_00022160 [Aphis craccivora]|uniref:Uncharacterized protein n=1 Tax=Aphis craccivora TaxID=307492 RepID=A0A6G0VR59_APHCR|nr:Uncharacterized protein FWK35_00022160 [Aphis craccivora]
MGDSYILTFVFFIIMGGCTAPNYSNTQKTKLNYSVFHEKKSEGTNGFIIVGEISEHQQLIQSYVNSSYNFIVFNSERSDECIVFPMLCVFFFVCLYTRKCRNNASISNFGGGFNSKTNLVGALGRSFFEFPNSFHKRWEKPKKN